MSLLLDTHALLWWLADDPRLSAPARQAIGNAENPVLVSAASLREIATKQRIGKMPHLTADFVLRLPDVLAEERMAELAVNARHAVRAGQHAAAHRAPRPVRPHSRRPSRNRTAHPGQRRQGDDRFRRGAAVASLRRPRSAGALPVNVVTPRCRLHPCR